MAKHTHSFKCWGYKGQGKSMVILERCKCGEESERPATKEEKAEYDLGDKRSSFIHRLSWPVMKKLDPKGGGWRCPRCQCLAGTKTGQCGVCGTKEKRTEKVEEYAGLSCLEAMKWMEKYAKRHPEIIACRVDDDNHCGSDLYLIPHYCDDGNLGADWMGVTVLYIPQCTGERPIRFFLYPQHHDGLLEALLEMKALRDAVLKKVPKERRGF
jgi:hypothetical protein